MGFEGFPFVVGWELTLACNLRCRHCASSAGRPRERELTLDEALGLCGQLPALAVQEVDFTGGEPLVREDWWRIAERLRELQITTRMVTNGLLLTPGTVERMKAVGLATVAVSIDGVEEVHDRIRASPGLFRRVLAGMTRLADAGIRLSAITAVSAVNLPTLPALLSLLESVGVDTWQLQPILPQGRTLSSPELALSDEEYVRIARFVRDARHETRHGRMKVVPADSLGYFTELDFGEPPWRGCAAGLASVGIRSDGRVTGCLSMADELVEGNLRERDLWDIWFDEGAFPYSRHFTTANLGPECARCAVAEQCRGGCTSMSHGCTGRLHNDPFCLTAIRHRSPEAFARASASPP
ncbi:MAG: radical SAM protein [Thermoanaerobaculia bacterium]|nr:radical SAM protein [Thermoanaerobaculia bacterium]